jgi:hypothetical protein
MSQVPADYLNTARSIWKSWIEAGTVQAKKFQKWEKAGDVLDGVFVGGYLGPYSPIGLVDTGHQWIVAFGVKKQMRLEGRLDVGDHLRIEYLGEREWDESQRDMYLEHMGYSRAKLFKVTITPKNL